MWSEFSSVPRAVRRSACVVRHVVVVGTAVAVVGLAGCGSGSEEAAAAQPPAVSPTPAASAMDPSPPDGSTIVAGGGELPDGVYRVEFTEEHLAAHGHDSTSIGYNSGIWTTTLEDGRWVVDQAGPTSTDNFNGVYQVDGDDLYWRFHDTMDVLHLTWSTDEQGDLHFTQVSDTGPHADFQFALPWVLVQ